MRAHRQSFPLRESETGGEQISDRIGRLSHAVRGMLRGVGEDMVELMRQHPAEGAPQGAVAILARQSQQLFSQKRP